MSPYIVSRCRGELLFHQWQLQLIHRHVCHSWAPNEASCHPLIIDIDWSYAQGSLSTYPCSSAPEWLNGRIEVLPEADQQKLMHLTF